MLHLDGHLYYLPTLMMHGQTQIKNTMIFEARNFVIYTAVPSEMIIQHEQLSGVFPWSQHRGYDRQIYHVEIR